MTLKEMKINDAPNHEEVLVKNNHRSYVFFKKKHEC